MFENPYFYLSMIGLVVKIWGAHRLRQNIHVPAAKLCFLFLLVAYAMTVLELYGFYLLSINSNADYYLLLKIYYALIVTFLFIMPLLFKAIIQTRSGTLSTIINAIFFSTLTYLILSSDQILAGASLTEHVATRVKGPYYWLFSLFSFYILFATLYELWRFYKRTNIQITAKLKSSNLIIGLAPMALLCIIMNLVMELGAPINAAGTTPIVLSVLILVMAENLRTDRILDLRVFIPWTEKARMIRQLTKPFREVTLEPETAKGLSAEYDKSLVKVAKNMFPTQKDAAAWLGITESKMSRMLKK